MCLVIEDSKENSIQQDHIESLIDHSSLSNKQIPKPTPGSSLKRSTSQPNLSEDLNSPQKLPISSESSLTTHTSRQLDPPPLNRQYKPRFVILFHKFIL